MNHFQALRKYKLIPIACISFLLTLVFLKPLNASMPDVDLNFLYQPRQRLTDVAVVPDLRDLEQAYNAISDIPNSQNMRIPIPSSNPRERIVAEGTVNPSTGRENPITAQGARGMFQREAAIRQRAANQRGARLEGQSVLIANASESTLAQYERCVYVGAWGADDRCSLDLVIRDTRTNQRWILPNVLIDKFCVYVMQAAVNRNWY